MMPWKLGPPMGRPQLNKLRNALLPIYEVVPVYWRDIKDQEAMLHRATEDQKGILELLNRQNFAAVEGGAGTGKTLLAVAKAQGLAASGHRTLLVCYNRALKDWLVQNLSDEFGALLSIQTYHNLVAEFCDKANIQFIEGGKSPDQKFWDEIAPERLMDACDDLAIAIRNLMRWSSMRHRISRVFGGTVLNPCSAIPMTNHATTYSMIRDRISTSKIRSNYLPNSANHILYPPTAETL